MSGIKKPQKHEKSVIVPPAGISRSGTSICVVCQLPGVHEEKIRIDLEQTRLIISAVNENGKIAKKITVPAGSWIRQKKFRDGILEIILELPL
ncbi:MAG: hypothetical protein WB986_05300 [Methanoregula sp.]|uniref:hypothetical protein n=1 Tax=Methanoregula sp. TaxID=2052170 RepID=UPI003BAE75EE